MRLALKSFNLSFPEEEKENAFAQSRVPFLINSLHGSSVILFLFTVLSILVQVGAVQGNISPSQQRPVLFVLGLDGLSLSISCGLFLYTRRYRLRCDGVLSGEHEENFAKSHLCPEHLERSSIAVALWGICFISTTNHFRAARLFGVDPEMAWNRNACEFTDSTFVLSLMTVVTGVGVFFPIRMRRMPVIPMATILSFVLTSFILGSPEKPWILLCNSFTMIMLSYMVLVGCRMTEARERKNFDNAFETRKEMVTEKITRFDLEHQIAQAKEAGEMHQGSSETQNRTAGTSSLSYSLSISGDGDSKAESASEFEGIDSWRDLRRATTGARHGGNSKGDCDMAMVEVWAEGSRPTLKTNPLPKMVLQGAVISHGSSTHTHPVTFASAAAQTVAQDCFVMQSTQTDVSWAEQGGFQCQQCNRPPPAPVGSPTVLTNHASSQGKGSAEAGGAKTEACESQGPHEYLEPKWLRYESAMDEKFKDRNGCSSLSAVNRNCRSESPTGSEDSRRSSKHSSIGTRRSSRHGSTFSLSSHKSFQDTPLSTKTFAALQMLRSWRVPQTTSRDQFCCSYHVSTAEGCKILQDLHEKPCKKDFAVFMEAQCGQCYSTWIDPGVAYCGVCGAEAWPDLSKVRDEANYSEMSLVTPAASRERLPERNLVTSV